MDTQLSFILHDRQIWYGYASCAYQSLKPWRNKAYLCWDVSLGSLPSCREIVTTGFSLPAGLDGCAESSEEAPEYKCTGAACSTLRPKAFFSFVGRKHVNVRSDTSTDYHAMHRGGTKSGQSCGRLRGSFIGPHLALQVSGWCVCQVCMTRPPACFPAKSPLRGRGYWTWWWFRWSGRAERESTCLLQHTVCCGSPSLECPQLGCCMPTGGRTPSIALCPYCSKFTDVAQ